jgi:hypothetical protein
MPIFHRQCDPVFDRAPGRRGWHAVGTTVALLAAGVAPQAARAQVAEDTASLGAGRFAVLRTVLERTFLRLDVLALELRLDAAAAARIEAASTTADTRAFADSVAAAVLGAADAWAQQRFLRDVNLDRLIHEIRSSIRNAVSGRMLSEAEYETISHGLSDWYATLRERGVRDGDVQTYRIHGDTVHVLLRDRDGQVLIDRTAVGKEHRQALLGSYFAPGSDFRDGLVRSLLR